ncbi:hypothetical protein O3P69_001578 [Scylla paramamosain]|uniref:Uncharacterized protein n=1 Tax=Scylla paramamosain TaxID=85552 RepID=A0AAW0UY85_SCYPA
MRVYSALVLFRRSTENDDFIARFGRGEGDSGSNRRSGEGGFVMLGEDGAAGRAARRWPARPGVARVVVGPLTTTTTTTLPSCTHATEEDNDHCGW